MPQTYRPGVGWVDDSEPALPTIPPQVLSPEDQGRQEIDTQIGRNNRYQESVNAADRLQAVRDRMAQSDMPPGSPSQYLGAVGEVLGRVSDERGIPTPPPIGTVGVRGYPTQSEYGATNRFNTNVERYGQANALAIESGQTTPQQIASNAVAEPPPYVPINRSQQYIDQADAYQSHRAGLESRRDALMQRLSALPPGPRGRANPQAAALTTQIHALNEDINNAHSNERMATAMGARQAHQDLIDNKSMQANREVAGLSRYLNANPYAPHSPEWENYMSEGLNKFPNGANTQGGRKIYGDHYGEAPPSAEQMRNAIQFARETGQQIQSDQLTKSGRLDFRFQPTQAASTKPPPSNVIARYEKLKADVQYHNDQSNVERSANIAAGKANVPYSKSANLNASRSELAALEQRFPQLNPNPTPQPATAQPTATVQPTATPNLLAAPANPKERVTDQIYTNPAGQRARWTGTGWIPIQ